MLIAPLAAALLLLALLSVLSLPASANPDDVTLSVNAGPPQTVFPDNTLITVKVTDGATLGGSYVATVSDVTGGADVISIDIYDDGTAPDDNADDGIFWGEFTVVDQGGIDGQFTDDVNDIIDLAHDSVGNVSIDMDAGEIPPTCCGIDFTTDFQAPSIDAILSPEGVVVHASYKVSLRLSDLNDFQAIWDDGQGGSGLLSNATTPSPDIFNATVPTSLLPEGDSQITVTITDAAGNVETHDILITYDHTIPDVELLNTDNAVIASDLIIGIEVVDAHLDPTAVTYVVDGFGTPILFTGAEPSYTATLDTTVLAEAPHYVVIVVADEAGNTNNQRSLTFIVDRTPPVLAIDLESTSIATFATLDVTATELHLSEVTYSVENEPGIPLTKAPGQPNGWTAEVNASRYIDGTHMLVVSAIDAGGSVTTADPIEVLIDHSGPSGSIVSLGGIVGGDYALDAKATDTLSSVAQLLYSWDDPSPNGGADLTHAGSDWVATVNTRAVLDGPHKLWVNAVDSLGNVETVGKVDLTIDNTKPLPSVAILPGTQFNSARSVVEITAFDKQGVTELAYAVGEGPWVTTSSFDDKVNPTWSPTIDWPGEGDLTFKARALDYAGNNQTKSVVVTVSIPPPAVGGLRVRDNEDGTVTLTWDASSVTDLRGYRVYQSLEKFDNVTLLFSVAEVEEATTYTVEGVPGDTEVYFAVVAVDSAGNYEPLVVAVKVKTKPGAIGPGPGTPPKVDVLSASTEQTKVKEGETVTVKVKLRNSGGAKATGIKVKLLVDSLEALTVTSDLLAGADREVSVEWTAAGAGKSHTLKVEVVFGGHSEPIGVGGPGNGVVKVTSVGTGMGLQVAGLPVLLFLFLMMALVVIALGTVGIARKLGKAKAIDAEADQINADHDAKAAAARQQQPMGGYGAPLGYDPFAAPPPMAPLQAAGGYVAAQMPVQGGASRIESRDVAGMWCAVAIWKVPCGYEPAAPLDVGAAERAVAMGPGALPYPQWSGPMQQTFEVHADFARTMTRYDQPMVEQGGGWVNSGAPTQHSWTDTRRIKLLHPAAQQTCGPWMDSDVQQAVSQMGASLR